MSKCPRHPNGDLDGLWPWCQDCHPEKRPPLLQPTEGMVETPAQSGTSAEAARRIRPLTGPGRLLVLRTIVAYHGCTDEEGCALTGLSPSTWRPRRNELHKGWKDFVGGYIFDSGKTRKTVADVPAIVWCATAKGTAAAKGEAV